MKRTAALTLLAAAVPNLAFAHGGHTHIGGAIAHHAAEGIAIAGIAVALWAGWSLLQKGRQAQ